MGEQVGKVALKQFPSIQYIGFGVGAGAVQTLEGFVQNRNDSPLFLKRRKRDKGVG